MGVTLQKRMRQKQYIKLRLHLYLYKDKQDNSIEQRRKTRHKN